MTITGRSCIPESNCVDGHIYLRVNEEKLPAISALPLTLLGGTFFYPLTFAVATFAEIYFSLHIAYCYFKKHACDRKIQKLEKLSDDQVQKVVNHRLEKLKKRLQKQEDEAVTELNKWPSQFNGITINDRKGALISHYHSMKSSIEDKGIMSFAEIIKLKSLEKSIRKINRYQRTKQEVYFFDQLLINDCKFLLKERYKFSKIRHGISQEVDKHYFKTVAKFQIPVIGLLLVLKDPQTTEDVLNKSTLVDKYNSKFKDWLKPY